MSYVLAAEMARNGVRLLGLSAATSPEGAA